MPTPQGRFASVLLLVLGLVFFTPRPSMAQPAALPSQGELKPANAAWRIAGPYAISGDTVIAGVAPASIGDFGAAVFVRTGSTWAEQAILRAAAAQQAGSVLSIAAVATSGTRVAVWWQRRVFCTPEMIICQGYANPETVEIFSRTGATWTREAAIATPAIYLYGFAASQGRWGRSPLAMSDEAVLVGAPSISSGQSGRVYVYHRTGAVWNPAATLAGIDPSEGDQFGGAVAFDGVTAIVSAANTYGPNNDVKFGFEPGGAYIFRKSGAAWTREAYLVDPQEVHFGSQVDISGDRAIIAGVGAYVYERGNGQWPRRSTLVTKNDPANTFTSVLAGVSIDGGIALIHRLHPLRPDGTTQVFARGTTTWAAAGNTFVCTFGSALLSGNTLLGYAATDPKLQAFTLDVASIPSPPQLSVSHPTLYFGARGGTVLTPVQTEAVTVTNARGAAVSWTVSADQPWLAVAGAATGNGTFTVSVKPGAYAVGTLLGHVTVAAAGIQPQTVDVTFTSYAATTAPWGTVDSPADHTTGVIGSIGITGWALHQVGIQRVSIVRHAVPAEGPASTLVFLGDAVMVEGARPDVEALAGQPFNYSAGWGFMILTNMLPNQGNGTFTLRAIAYGLDGSATDLGQRTITCANATATMPFGAIDTPGQGATIAGAQYLNWGWALAPQPRMIPSDGSTISVYVDGVSVGHPAYGFNRADIAGLFPGLMNSTSAVGYRTIDTTALPNGVHTISWVVADNANNTSGIGSRFFTIQNNGAAAQTAASQSVRSWSPRPDDKAWTSPVTVRHGYAENANNEDVPPTGEGARMIAATALDRVEVHLGDTGGGSFEGRLVAGTEMRPLPIGSQLDAKTGVFIWQPGVGFFGQYDLVFLRQTASGTERLLLTIVLGSKRSGASDVTFAIDTPPGPAAESFIVGGWAFDRGARTGTGIDTVHVWAYPADGDEPTFLGAATVGGDRPDVGTAFGATARFSGYGLVVSGLAPGTYDIAVFPHSVVTNAFVGAKIVRVTIAFPSPATK